MSILGKKVSDKFKEIPKALPMLPVRDVVLFPAMVLPLAIGRDKSIRALEETMTSDRYIFVVTQKNLQIEDPSPNDIFQIGTVCEVLQMLKMPDGTLKVLVESITRAQWTDFRLSDKGYVEVGINLLDDSIENNPEVEAVMRSTINLFEQYVKLNPRMPMEISISISNIQEPSKLADTIASHISIKNNDKQSILETVDPLKRLDKIVQILNAEIEILNIERRIQNRVHSQIEKNQKEYYLNEQMKAIQKELKQKDDNSKEIDELRKKVKESSMSEQARTVANKELDRMEKMMATSPESSVIRTYIEWLLDLPWQKMTKDNLDLKRAKEILDQDHYGLDKVKERIIEYLAVLSRVNKIKGPILCFIGPPGVGKTSIAKSVARSLGRNFVRISMGGVRDEAEIRGHRRTYIGSMPGKIIQSMKKAGSGNPVFILDEIDKMGSDWRGDPSAALLEVLDPEQNYAFGDHYLDVDYDLSNVMFITTANTLNNIPVTLLDRLEIIRFSGYTDEEKLSIAKKFLIPKQKKDHGLKDEELTIDDEAVKTIIASYTREAGVRNLNREIANLCRKAATELSLKNNIKAVKIAGQKIEKYLGVPHYEREKISENDIGVVTGLAWTEVGGETLTIEVNKMKGKGMLNLTGQLGNVMKESVQAAFTYVKSSAKKLKIDEKMFKNTDFHVHVPEGAVPKDGPSAGLAMATALASVCMNKPVRKKLAMTGEITLRGRALTIGGLKEKVLAAYREGIDMVLFPEGNKKDLTDIPENVKKKIKMIPVKHMDEVIKYAFENKKSK